MDVALALLGRLHPSAVHFPIALLVTATVGIALAHLRRRAPSRTLITLVHVAAAAAVGASVLGLAWAASSEADDVELHRLVTLAGTALAVVASVLYSRRERGRYDAVKALLLTASTALVAYGGHVGGVLALGEDHYSSAFEVSAPPPPPAPPEQPPEKEEPPPPEERPPAPAKVEFAAEIWPILEKSCIRCHGAKKQKGKLRLDSKARALRGGESGAVIIPGDGAGSKLYELVSLPPDHDDVMPSKGKKLTKEQQQLIKRWIDEGADWPEPKK